VCTDAGQSCRGSHRSICIDGLAHFHFKARRRPDWIRPSVLKTASPTAASNRESAATSAVWRIYAASSVSVERAGREV